MIADNITKYKAISDDFLNQLKNLQSKSNLNNNTTK